MAEKTATFKMIREAHGYIGYVCVDDKTGKPCTAKQYTAPDSHESDIHHVPLSVKDEAEAKGYLVVDEEAIFTGW